MMSLKFTNLIDRWSLLDTITIFLGNSLTVIGTIMSEIITNPEKNGLSKSDIYTSGVCTYITWQK